MKTVRSSILSYVVPVFAIVTLTLLLTAALLRLAEIQRDMRSNVNSNMLWVLSQAQFESLRLSEAVYRHSNGLTAADDLNLRYNVLISRINLFVAGPQARYLEEIGANPELANYARTIRDLRQWIDQLASGDAESVAHIQATLQPLNQLLARTSNQAMVMQWEEAGARLDKYRNAVLAVIFLMIGILVSGAFISVNLLLALKRARESELTKLRAAELEKQLEAERKVSELYRGFGAMISHQFRTPLAIIDASMQRLVRTGDALAPGEVVRRAVKVRAATKRLTQLIESTLTADRFSGDVDAKLQEFDLFMLAHEAADHQRAITPVRRISLSSADAVDLAWCDPVLTEHILFNFISNAIKYSQAGTAIKLHVYAQDGWICCSVTDQGPGISKADMPYLFDRYYRSSASADIVGTGIGLYVTRQLASMQGGQTEAESIEGRGSVFTLRLRSAVNLRAASADPAMFDRDDGTHSHAAISARTMS